MPQQQCANAQMTDLGYAPRIKHVLPDILMLQHSKGKLSKVTADHLAI